MGNMKEALPILPSVSESTSSTLTPEHVFSDVQNAEMPPSEDERQERIDALREWAREYFEVQYPRLRVTDFFSECERLGLMRTREATGDEERDKKRILEEALSGRIVNVEALRKQMTSQPKPSIESGAASVFFEELIDFTITKERDKSDSLERYGANIESVILRTLGGTWKTSGLTISEEILLATRSAESPLLRRHLFPSLAHEAAARLGEAEERDILRIAADFSQEGPGTALSLIRTFSALAESVVFDENKRQSLDHMGVILRAMAESDIAVVHFAALHAVGSLAPTAEARRAYRPIERAKEMVTTPEKKRGTDRLTRTIIRNISDTDDDSTVARVASDAIVFRDRDSSAHAACIVPAELLNHLEAIDSSRDWKSIHIVRKILESDRRGSLTRKETGQVISDLAKYLFDDGALADTEGLSRTFSSLSDALTQTQWKGLLDDTARIRHCYAATWKERDRVDERYAAEEKLRGKDILIQVIDTTETASSGHRDIPDSAIDLARRLREALTTDNIDSGIEYLERWLEETSKIDGSFRKTVSEKLRLFWKTSAEAIQREFLDKQKAEAAVRRRLDISDIEKRREETLGYLAKEASGFRNDALAYVQARIDEAKSKRDLLLVTPESYETLLSLQQLTPFRKPNEENVRLLQNLHAPEGTDLLGIDFSRLPLRAQIHFLSFRGKEKTSDAERFRLALKKHEAIADDLAYSFLATAEGPEYGEIILSLAESLDSEVLGPILKKYVEITKDTDSVADYVRESFPNLGSAEAEQEPIAISKNLLRRGRDLLVDFSKNAHTDSETILRKLDAARTDVILYKTAFRTLHESGSAEDLAEMMKSEIASLPGTELGTEEQDALLAIYDRNYPESDRYPAEFRRKIFDGLREAFGNSDSRFYILRREGKVLGFRRFEKQGISKDGKTIKYAGSFNIDTDYRDAKIGDVFYQVTLEREGKDSIIEAMVDPEVPVSSFYVERYGFVIDGVAEISGKPFLRMRRDVETNASFVTRGADFDEIISDIPDRADEINGRLSSVFVQTVRRAELYTLVRDMTERGFTLTRLPYDTGGRDSGAVIAIFENPSLRKQTTNVAKNESVPEAA